MGSFDYQYLKVSSLNTYGAEQSCHWGGACLQQAPMRSCIHLNSCATSTSYYTLHQHFSWNRISWASQVPDFYTTPVSSIVISILTSRVKAKFERGMRLQKAANKIISDGLTTKEKREKNKRQEKYWKSIYGRAQWPSVIPAIWEAKT